MHIEDRTMLYLDATSALVGTAHAALMKCSMSKNTRSRRKADLPDNKKRALE
jgi:hypothetical protein